MTPESHPAASTGFRGANATTSVPVTLPVAHTIGLPAFSGGERPVISHRFSAPDVMLDEASRRPSALKVRPSWKPSP